jgi:hypothetical protein
MKQRIICKALAVAVIILLSLSVTPSIGISNNDDTTPPVTIISLNGTISEHGIYSTEVEVTLNATDDLSGVNVTYYDLDGNGDEIYIEPFLVTSHGMHMIVYWSVDNAGNVEEYKDVHFEIDFIPPNIGLSWKLLDNKSIEFNPWVSDDGSGSYKVEYYIDNAYMHTSYWEDSFNWIWKPPHWGTYLISGIVYDRAENTDQDWIDVYISRSRIGTYSMFQYLLDQFPLLEVFLRILNI